MIPFLQRIAVLSSLAVLFASTAFAAEIVRGPMLQKPGADRIMVVFDLDRSAEAEIRYGLQGGEMDLIAQAGPARKHKILIEGLQAGTVYDYQVFSGGLSIGGPYRLKTAPNPGEVFNFGIVGDTRSGHSQHLQLLERLNQEEFDFYVNSGDLVSSGEVDEDWEYFFDIEKIILPNHTLFPTIGNHDEDAGQAELYVGHFEIPDDNSGKEEYYSFTYGNVHFTVLDGHVNITPQWLCIQLIFMGDCFSGEQMAWLENDLLQAQADPIVDHIIVMTHIGPYSSKEGRSGSAQMRSLMPLFMQYGVDLILAGHDHYYERGLSNNGIPYVISGGGGAGLYTPDNDNTLLYPHSYAVRNKVNHYGVVNVTGTLMEFTFTDINGAIIDSFDIGARPACTAASVEADCGSAPPNTCRGHWECLNFECSWVCDPDTCITPEDCNELDPPTACEGGRWECRPDNVCEWYCPPEPECLTDADCIDKPPYNDCIGGHYICEDAVCDWMCGIVTDGDENADGDAPLSDGDAASPDGDGPETEVVAQVCTPGVSRCEGNLVMLCNGAGDGWEMVEDCSPRECVFGRCDGARDGGGGSQAAGGGDGCNGAGAPIWIVLLLPALLAGRRRIFR